jgi:hypothetical protein
MLKACGLNWQQTAESINQRGDADQHQFPGAGG